MPEHSDLPTSPIFVLHGGDVTFFPDPEAAASWTEAAELTDGAYQGYGAIGRRLRTTTGGGSVTIELAEPTAARAEDLARALRTFLRAADERQAADPTCGLPCLVELSRRHMQPPGRPVGPSQELLRSPLPPEETAAGRSRPPGLVASVGLPIAGLWEILTNPGWFGMSRALIHEGIPLLILAAFMGVALPDVGLPRRQGLLVPRSTPLAPRRRPDVLAGDQTARPVLGPAVVGAASNPDLPGGAQVQPSTTWPWPPTGRRRSRTATTASPGSG